MLVIVGYVIVCHCWLSHNCNNNKDNKNNLPPEIRIGVGGNVDAGKSSFVGVITKNILDNGRGYARSFILKHKHEQETGRTSAVSQQYIRTSDKVIEFNDLAGHEKYYKCTAKELSNSFLDYIFIVN